MCFLLLLLFLKILFLIYVFLRTCLCMQHGGRCHRGQKEVLDPLDLELQVDVSHSTLGTELWSSKREQKALIIAKPSL